MEFVDGVTLRAWLRTKPRLDSVVRMFVAVGEGLAAAHAAGLVHGDVKPENVVVGNDGRVRVVDFGLARDASVEASPAGDVVVGTPHYMASEQYEAGPLDARTDQFAFCVALHEAVHGVLPFRGTTLVARYDESRRYY